MDKEMMIRVYGSRTNLILRFCRLEREMRKSHAVWCEELVTGLWHSCDCGLHHDIDEKNYVLSLIKQMK
jgi:hypothetical protein